MFVLSQKLKEVKTRRIQWNRDVLGNVAAALTTVDQIQENIDRERPILNLLDAEKLTLLDLDKALMLEEEFKEEKSKIKQHLHGERNTYKEFSSTY